MRITGARASLAEDVRGRQRRYVISMGIRTLCVIATVMLWHVNMWLAWATLAGGLLLPYIAVVYANAGREQPQETPTTFIYQSGPPELEAGSRTLDGPGDLRE
ncbi:DUF3099 domain-containing protein [Mangrovactinospora gilvigrisea]|uniref:DUF3099 domain-containing protein n=1 Tax=Mangrovactinospora gilvigrisea TaxID=1428644 RepID=UPI003AF363A1